MERVRRIHDRGPALLTALAGVGAASSWLDLFEQVIQIGAGAVAIVSGVSATVYYVSKHLREKKGNGKV